MRALRQLEKLNRFQAKIDRLVPRPWSEQDAPPTEATAGESPCAGMSFPDFCERIEIRLKSGGLVPFSPSTWFAEQWQFERTRTGWDVVCKPRQIGFSTIELARDLWFAVTRKGVNVLVIGHDAQLAEQLFVTVRIMADALRRQGLLPATRHDNLRELVFAGLGSAIRVVEAGATERSAQNKGRSGTVHRLHCTETAFWKAAASTMDGVMASVPDDGEVCIESTTNGVGGLFYDMVLGAKERRTRYALHFYAWYEHEEYAAEVPNDFDPSPRDEWEKKLRAFGCDDRQIQWWRGKVADPSVGLEKALQNYPIDVETAFRSGGDAYIDAQAVDVLAQKAFAEPLRVVPVFAGTRKLGEFKVWREPVPGAAYCIGADVAEGIGKDATTAVVIGKKTALCHATFSSTDIEPGEFGQHVLPAMGYLFNRAVVAPERQNHGHATLAGLKAAGYTWVYEAPDKKLGWLTSTVTRPVLFDELAQAIREGVADMPDAAVTAEARTLIRDDDGKPRAKGKGKAPPEGCRDDLFVGWGIAFQVRQYTPQEFRAERATGIYV